MAPGIAEETFNAAKGPEHVSDAAAALSLSAIEVLLSKKLDFRSASANLLARLLKPLLLNLDAGLRAAGNHSSLPSRALLAQNWREAQRLPALLKALIAEPTHQGFQAIYSHWLTQHAQLLAAYESGQVDPPPFLEVNRSGSQSRVSPDFFCTVWAKTYSVNEPNERPLDLLALLDEALLNSSKLEREARVATKEAIQSRAEIARVEKRIKKKTQQQIDKLEREIRRLQGRVQSEQAAKKECSQQLSTAREQLVKLYADQLAATSKARQEEDLREKELIRRREIHRLLREEREQTRRLEQQNDAMSAALLKREIEAQRLKQRIEDELSGPAGINQLLTTLVDEQELMRDTAQGGVRLQLSQRITKLKSSLRAFKEAYPEFADDYRPPSLRIPKAAFRVRALGGGDHVGASCYLLEIGAYSVLVDCGIRVNAADIENLGPAGVLDLEKIDAVVLTHAHTDHSGWIPALVARGFEFDVYCTAPTQDLLRVMLDDSRKQLERLLAEDSIRARYTNRPPAREPYTRRDVEDTYLRVRPVEFDTPVQLGPDLHFSLVRAGHILGGAGVLFEGFGRRIFFSGDFSTFSQLTVDGCRWPTDELPFDLVITESTYGNRARGDRAAEIDAFVRQIADTIAGSGTVVIPSFALGRAQEVISILEAAMASGKLARVPVYMDGMIEKINEIYREYECVNWGPNFKQVIGDGFSRDEVVAACKTEPSIIVATSGMLAGGPVVLYACELLKDPRNRILFCGYQDEEQPGARLLRLSRANAAERHVEIQDENGETVTIVAASPALQFHLSAHSDQQQIIEAVCALHPREVMLVHGDDQARAALAALFKDRGIHAPLDIDLATPAQ